jgi:hypothetical protein
LGTEGQAITERELGAEGLRFHIGSHLFDFLTPRDASSPLIDWLRRFGPSPYSAVLNASSTQTLASDLTHGANLVLR